MLKANMKIGKVSNQIFEDNWFTPEMGQKILEQIGQSASESVRYSIQPGASIRLAKLINELSNLYTDEKNNIQMTENKLSYYNAERWGDFIYQKKSRVTWGKVFKICSEILDILRTGHLDEHLQLVVFSTSKDGSLSKVYYGDESKVSSLRSKRDKDDREELQFNLKKAKLKMQDLEKDNLFAQHYNEFKKAIENSEELNEKYSSNKFNEGHIIEAFQRHLYFQHNITRMNEDVFNDPSLKEPVSLKMVAINLYYAMNSEGWWTGGDVGSMQDKGKNRTLASLMSIKMVASRLFSLVQHYENFDVNNFKELFTQGELDQMSEEDPKRVGNQAIGDLISSIGGRT